MKNDEPDAQKAAGELDEVRGQVAYWKRQADLRLGLYDTDVATLRADREALRAENARLEERLAGLKAEKAVAVRAVLDRVKELLADNEALRARVQALERKAIDYTADVAVRLREKDARITELEADLLKQRDAKNSYIQLAGKNFEEVIRLRARAQALEALDAAAGERVALNRLSRLDGLLASKEPPEGLRDCAAYGHAGGIDGRIEVIRHAWRWFREQLAAPPTEPQEEHPGQWLVVICREGVTEATPFESKSDAAAFFDRASLQWSESYLAHVVQGPRDGWAIAAEPQEAGEGADRGASPDPADWPGGVPTDPGAYFQEHPLTEEEIAHGQNLGEGAIDPIIGPIIAYGLEEEMDRDDDLSRADYVGQAAGPEDEE